MQRAPFPARKYLTFVPPTRPVVEVALQLRGCLVFGQPFCSNAAGSRTCEQRYLVKSQQLRRRSKGRSMAQAPATRGLRGGHQWR